MWLRLIISYLDLELRSTVNYYNLRLSKSVKYVFHLFYVFYLAPDAVFFVGELEQILSFLIPILFDWDRIKALEISIKKFVRMFLNWQIFPCVIELTNQGFLFFVNRWIAANCTSKGPGTVPLIAFVMEIERAHGQFGMLGELTWLVYHLDDWAVLVHILALMHEALACLVLEYPQEHLATIVVNVQVLGYIQNILIQMLGIVNHV